jgi:hypothetical protein
VAQKLGVRVQRTPPETAPRAKRRSDHPRGEATSARRGGVVAQLAKKLEDPFGRTAEVTASRSPPRGIPPDPRPRKLATLPSSDSGSAPDSTVASPDSGGQGDAGSADTGSADAGSADTGSADAGAADAGPDVDATDASDAAPCTPWPDGGVTYACGNGGGSATAPGQFCFQEGSDPGQAETTPTQCSACREDFTCACVEQFNPYCATDEIVGRFPDDGGFTIVCE